jgi:threonine/homoserine/homoserine lactone efflux protein
VAALLHFLQGFLIGFALAAPVGPVGILCIRRSITYGRLVGFLSGMGAAFADGIFGLVAALGITSITSFITRHETAFQLTGGLFLIVMGLATLRVQPPPAEGESGKTAGLSHASLPKIFLSTFLIAIINPATITATIGIFTGFAVDLRTSGFFQGLAIVLGVFLGSVAWWAILSTAAAALARRIGHGGLRFIDLSAGIFIALFGVWQLVRLALK